MSFGLKRASVSVCAVFLLLVVAAFPCPAQEARQGIRPGESLSLEKCTDIALENHPALKSAAGALAASRSRVYQARAPYYPQVTVSSRYDSRHSASDNGSGRSSDSELEGAAHLSQTIFDFGRTSASVLASSFLAESSRAGFEDVQDRVVLQVKQAYYNLSKSKGSREAYAQAVSQYERHLDHAERLYAAGVKPRIDVTMAEVDLGRARLDLLKAENTLRIARITLNNAMGVPDAPAYEIVEEQKTEPGFDRTIDLEEALSTGYEFRADLVSVRATREAAERSVDLARRQYYPVLSGNAGYGWTGDDFPLKREWTVGAELTFPLFNGFLTRHRVHEAKADLETLKGNEELVRQNVRFDVEEAFYNLEEARERIGLAGLVARQAAENRDLAQGRYREGVGNGIEVTDALVAEINAKTEYINALFDFRIAVAGLERAMGVRR